MSPGHDAEVAKLGDIAGEAGLERVSILAWRDLDDPEAGGSEVHAANIASLWAEAGIEVTMRTSYAANYPMVSWRDGYRVIRKAGRYLVFPRAAFSEMMGWHGGRDGLVEIWNGMPFFSPLWARTAARHLAAPRARGDVADDAAAPPRGVRQLRRVEGRAADLPAHADRHAVGVEQAGVGPRPPLPCRSRRPSSRPGIDPQFTPEGEKSPDPLVVGVGRLVPVKRYDMLIDALVALEAAPSGTARGDRGRGLLPASDLEAQIRAARAEDWISLPGRIDDDEVDRPLPAAWVLSMTSSREGWGMIVTEAAACGTPAVVTRVPGFVDAVVEGRTGLLADTRDELTAGLDTRALRSPTCAPARCRRARARGPLHLGGDGTRHPRGARAGRDPASHPPVTVDAHRALSARGVRRRRGASRPARLRFLGYAALAALAYIPMLLTAPGRVVADTKSYLYLDPGRLLERAPSMWDPNIGLGTVTHQNIGYLFPMGPYYWADALRRGAGVGLATPLARHASCCSRRSGMLYLLRTLHVRGPGRGRRGARVHALAVRARLRGAPLGDPAARGRGCRGCSRS